MQLVMTRIYYVTIEYGLLNTKSDSGMVDNGNSNVEMDDDFKQDDIVIKIVEDGFEKENSDVEGVE